MFTGRVYRQTKRLYVLRMIVKLANSQIKNIATPLYKDVLYVGAYTSEKTEKQLFKVEISSR